MDSICAAKGSSCGTFFFPLGWGVKTRNMSYGSHLRQELCWGAALDSPLGKGRGGREPSSCPKHQLPKVVGVSRIAEETAATPMAEKIYSQVQKRYRRDKRV